jgi:thiol:disulfide interchange protein DsbD
METLLVITNCPDEESANAIALAVVEAGWPPASTSCRACSRSTAGRAPSSRRRNPLLIKATVANYPALEAADPRTPPLRRPGNHRPADHAGLARLPELGGRRNRPMTMRILFFLFSLLVSLAHADEFLDPAVAFKPSVRALDGQTIEVSYEIAKGYYLYRDKFRFRRRRRASRSASQVFPKGKEHNDENFGKVEVYYKQVAIRVPVERTSSGPLPLKLNVTSQGCADAGVCYPPQTQAVSVTLPDPASAPPAVAAAAEGDESGMIASTLKHAGFWANLAFFFLAGLGLSLTPCVFPMIPILSGIIVGQGHKVSHAARLRAVAGLRAGHGRHLRAAGVAAGLTGTLLSAALQNAVGARRLRAGLRRAVLLDVRLLRAAAADRAAEQAVGRHRRPPAGRARHRRFPDGRAVGADRRPLRRRAAGRRAALHRQTGDAVLGGTALFVMALGMGAPLIAGRRASRTLLPKTGPWMEGVKKAFGVMLLATAVWLVSPVIPGSCAMLAWALLLMFRRSTCTPSTRCRRTPRAGSASGRASASSCC